VLTDLTETRLGDSTGRRIYEVSRDGETSYYLTLISTLQGAVYVLTEEPMTVEKMDEIAGF
jgi:hypothetical protein